MFETAVLILLVAIIYTLAPEGVKTVVKAVLIVCAFIAGFGVTLIYFYLISTGTLQAMVRPFLDTLLG